MLHSFFTQVLVLYQVNKCFIYLFKQGVCHCGLAIYIKKHPMAKEDLWKFKNLL
jgi:hypothetical protein